MVYKIISGGQSGADQGALFAARDLGIATGGFAPLGWRTEYGAAPWLEKYGLHQAPSSAYSQRTRLNVINSDGTLVFGDVSSFGSKLTVAFARDLNKPLFIKEWRSGEPTPKVSDKLLEWLSYISTLNVAGNRESTQPGITDIVREFLTTLLRRSKCDTT